jgi:glutaminase
VVAERLHKDLLAAKGITSRPRKAVNGVYSELDGLIGEQVSDEKGVSATFVLMRRMRMIVSAVGPAVDAFVCRGTALRHAFRQDLATDALADDTPAKSAADVARTAERGLGGKPAPPRQRGSADLSPPPLTKATKVFELDPKVQFILLTTHTLTAALGPAGILSFVRGHLREYPGATVQVLTDALVRHARRCGANGAIGATLIAFQFTNVGAADSTATDEGVDDSSDSVPAASTTTPVAATGPATTSRTTSTPVVRGRRGGGGGQRRAGGAAATTGRAGKSVPPDDVEQVSRTVIAAATKKGELRREVVIDPGFVLCTLAAVGDAAALSDLISRGNDPNARDYEGRSPLHVAAVSGNLMCVRVLLKRGADVNCVDKFGRTPLREAIERMHTETANVLREAGGTIGRKLADATQSTAGAKAVALEDALFRYRALFDHICDTVEHAEAGEMPLSCMLEYLESLGLVPARIRSSYLERIGSRPLTNALREVLSDDGEYVLWSRLSRALVRSRAPTALEGAVAKAQNQQQLAADLEYEAVQAATRLHQQSDPTGVESAAAEELVDLEAKQEAARQAAEKARQLADSTAEMLGQMHNAPSPLQKVFQADLAISDWALFCQQVTMLYEDVLRNVHPEQLNAKVSTDNQALAEYDPDMFGISIISVDGQCFSIGDSDVEFVLEDVSRPLMYALVCDEQSEEYVHSYVGREPHSGSIYALNRQNKPHNAIAASGAMTLSSMFRSKQPLTHRFNAVSKRFSELSGDLRTGFSQSSYLAEQATSYGTFALAHFIAQALPTTSSIQSIVDFYYQVRSIEVSCESLAAIGATFANRGVSPLSGRKVIDEDVVKSTLQLMYSCGLYDFSGEWATTVGLPAKAAATGALFVVLPNKVGMCVWSPPLGEHGNSVRAVEFCRRLARLFRWSILDTQMERQVHVCPHCHSNLRGLDNDPIDADRSSDAESD